MRKPTLPRQLTTALAALLAVSALTFTSPPEAQAATGLTGTWNSLNSSTFSIPSNWKCAGSLTAMDGRSVAQSCLVRSGNYVQAAVIVRNLTSSNFSTAAGIVLTPRGQYVGVKWRCPASSLAPRGLSVCLGKTLYRPKAQKVGGDWRSYQYYEAPPQYTEAWR